MFYRKGCICQLDITVEHHLLLLVEHLYEDLMDSQDYQVFVNIIFNFKVCYERLHIIYKFNYFFVTARTPWKMFFEIFHFSIKKHDNSDWFFVLEKPPIHGPCKGLDFELEMVISFYNQLSLMIYNVFAQCT